MKIFGRTSNRLSWAILTEGRILLWDRELSTKIPNIVEITMEEIANKMGVPVGQLKIKD